MAQKIKGGYDPKTLQPAVKTLGSGATIHPSLDPVSSKAVSAFYVQNNGSLYGPFADAIIAQDWSNYIDALRRENRCPFL